MKRIFPLIATFVLFLCISSLVAQSSFLKLNRKYRKKGFVGNTCAVVILDTIFVDFDGSVESYFGEGEKADLIQEYFRTNFPKCFQENSAFTEVYIDSCTTKYDTELTPIQSPVPSKSYCYYPKDNKTLSFRKGTPDYVLFIYNMGIVSKELDKGELLAAKYGNSHTIPGAPGQPGMTFHTINPEDPHRPISYSSTFVLWDNKEGKIAGKGYGDHMQGTGKEIEKETWEKITNEFSAMIGVK